MFKCNGFFWFYFLFIIGCRLFIVVFKLLEFLLVLIVEFYYLFLVDLVWEKEFGYEGIFMFILDIVSFFVKKDFNFKFVVMFDLRRVWFMLLLLLVIFEMVWVR